MRVLVDTNILVSAILRDRDPEAILLYIAAQSDIEWVVSAEILAEYKEVLSRKKFALPDDLREQWFDMFDQMTT